MAKTVSVGKNILFWAVAAIIVALGLTYVFWGVDFIPDQAASVLPGGFVGYIDDAVAILLMFITLAKWRQYITGKPGMKANWKMLLIFTPIIALVLVYIFTVIDIIPDTIPGFGYLDDVIVILLGGLAAGKLYKKFVKKE